MSMSMISRRRSSNVTFNLAIADQTTAEPAANSQIKRTALPKNPTRSSCLRSTIQLNSLILQGGHWNKVWRNTRGSKGCVIVLSTRRPWLFTYYHSPSLENSGHRLKWEDWILSRLSSFSVVARACYYLQRIRHTSLRVPKECKVN